MLGITVDCNSLNNFLRNKLYEFTYMHVVVFVHRRRYPGLIVIVDLNSFE